MQNISYALFRQFQSVLRAHDPDASYPAMPSLAEMEAAPIHSIQECFDAGGVRFILLDGRSGREPRVDASQPGWMHTQAQREWLVEQARQHSGLKVIASGVTLKRGSESWDQYKDYEWLMGCKIKNAIVLSGDIHANVFKVHKFDGYALPEATASGAALPRLGGGVGNYGLLDVADGRIDRLTLCTSEEETPYLVQASG